MTSHLCNKQKFLVDVDAFKKSTTSKPCHVRIAYLAVEQHQPHIVGDGFEVRVEQIVYDVGTAPRRVVTQRLRRHDVEITLPCDSFAEIWNIARWRVDIERYDVAPWLIDVYTSGPLEGVGIVYQTTDIAKHLESSPDPWPAWLPSSIDISSFDSDLIAVGAVKASSQLIERLPPPKPDAAEVSAAIDMLSRRQDVVKLFKNNPTTFHVAAQKLVEAHVFDAYWEAQTALLRRDEAGFDVEASTRQFMSLKNTLTSQRVGVVDAFVGAVLDGIWSVLSTLRAAKAAYEAKPLNRQGVRQLGYSKKSDRRTPESEPLLKLGDPWKASS